MSKLDMHEAIQAIGERIILLASEDDLVREHLRLMAEELSKSTPASAENPVGGGEGNDVRANSNGSQDSINRSDAELQEVEARCRVKAEGCRWTAERVRLREEGAEHQIDIAPHDRYILDRARQLSHCDLWMNRPGSPVPDDLSLLEDVGGCFDALADSVAVARFVQTDRPHQRYLLAEALQLVAEAQSALRSSIQQIDGPTDSDQLSAYRWVIETAEQHNIFIERFARRDDPANPQCWPDLRSRIQFLRERIEDKRRLDQRRRQLECKLRHQLGEASDADLGHRLAGWKAAARTVHDLVQTGVPPSNVELRQVLLPHVGNAPQFDDPPQGYVLALREIERFQEGRVTCDTPTERATTREVTKAAKLLHGKRIVLIGGDYRPGRKEALEQAFGLNELVWVQTKPGQSVNSFAPFVARPDVALVLLAIRWASHGFVEVRRFCDRYEKPLVWLPGGCGVNQVAAHILSQCSDRLKLIL